MKRVLAGGDEQEITEQRDTSTTSDQEEKDVQEIDKGIDEDENSGAMTPGKPMEPGKPISIGDDEEYVKLEIRHYLI